MLYREDMKGGHRAPCARLLWQLHFLPDFISKNMVPFCRVYGRTCQISFGFSLLMSPPLDTALAKPYILFL